MAKGPSLFTLTMGLECYSHVRAWIRFHIPSAVLLPQNIRPEADDSCIELDLTQLLRFAPPQLTGDDFCRWFSRFVEGLPCKFIVAVMDKPTWVPPEKEAVQKKRTRREETTSEFSEKSVFGPKGVQHDPPHGVWKRFDGGDALSCRPARGRLVEWINQWSRKHRVSEQQLVMEYEYPKGKERAVQIGPSGASGSIDWLASKAGEADIVQLKWVELFQSVDNIALQIDSDILPIALLHLLRTPPEKHPKSWVWVAANKHWLNEPIMATQETDADGFTLVTPTPLAIQLGLARKGDKSPKEPIFCVDLLKLYEGIRKAAYAFPCLDDQSDRVRCFVESCILQDTDYYEHQQEISKGVTFELQLDAMQRSYVKHWKPLEQWWASTGSWSYERMLFSPDDVKKTQRQKESDLIMIGEPPEAFKVLQRWQLQLAKRKAKKDESDVPAEPYELGKLLEGGAKRQRVATNEQMVAAHRELMFNVRYWDSPFISSPSDSSPP